MKSLLQSLCTVVVENTLDEFLTSLQIIQNQADWIEIRADFIKNLSARDVEILKNHTHKKAIFCCRAATEGGQFLGTRAAQQEMLQIANDVGFEYIDIDLSIASKIKIKNKKAQQIISYHDYQHTPRLTELQELLSSMRQFQPDVFKFAVTTHSPKDCHTLIQFLINKEKYDRLIVLGMGNDGKMLRLLAPLLGGYLTFATVGVSSAPGQMELNEMRDLYQRIEKLIQ